MRGKDVIRIGTSFPSFFFNTVSGLKDISLEAFKGISENKKGTAFTVFRVGL